MVILNDGVSSGNNNGYDYKGCGSCSDSNDNSKINLLRCRRQIVTYKVISEAAVKCSPVVSLSYLSFLTQ